MTTNLVTVIDPKSVIEQINSDSSNIVLLDVRSTDEFAALHATPAINLPLQDINEKSIEELRNKQVICICQSGTRGEQAAILLKKLGVTEVKNVKGGTAAWKNLGLPFIKGPTHISLERQVRIAAGLLVSLGMICGFFIDSNFYVVPMFIGAGLVYSGVTNTCGLAKVLGYCPWNKIG